jgi:hypothetical protein
MGRPPLPFVASLSSALSSLGEGGRLTAFFARRRIRLLLDGTPLGVRGMHFDSHPYIIVTNAQLQA